MKFFKLFILPLFAVGSLFIISTATASAVNVPNAVTTFAEKSAADCKGGDFFGLPTWFKYLKFDDNCNPITSQGSVAFLVMLAIADILLWAAGFLAVVFVIFGGFKFITSQGEPQQIAGARKTILNALIGLAIAVLAAQLVSFIARALS